MTIHHTIIKLAARQGVILTQNDDTIEAHHAASNTRVSLFVVDDGENDQAREALNSVIEMATWKAEPSIKGVFITCDEGVFTAESAEGDVLTEETSWSDLHDFLTNYAPEALDEEEPHSAVDEKYKILYAQIGIDGQDNGDWLAAQMLTLCSKQIYLVAAVAWANGIQRDPEPGNRGWEGRYRMTISNMLRKRVADQGHLVVPNSVVAGGGRIDAPAEFVARWATRPRVRKAKKGGAE